MQKHDFLGVMAALTTKMTPDENVDLDGVVADVEFQLSAGVDAIVVCGSLGEASTLTVEEKLTIARTAIAAAARRKPVVLTIAEDSTRAAARLASDAEKIGIEGLLVLPAMRYLADDREVVAHYRGVARASSLPTIIYNNPLAYGIDINSEILGQLADDAKFVAIKESTGDTRRINETLRALGDRYVLLTGVDDLALEGLVLGCQGWIAGLVDAFPHETVALYRLATSGRIAEAMEIYRWFLPLLHLDVGARFVQNIKLVEHIVRGTSRVTRAPRLPLSSAEAARIRTLTEASLRTRPDLHSYNVL